MRIDRYDVAVAGGGVAAVFHACSLAAHGHKVVILAEGSSLMHELGLSRLPMTGAADLASRYPLVQAWLELLERHGGVKGELLEPVWVQLLADRFVRELGIDVLFEVVPVRLLTDDEGSGHVSGVQVATREGLWTIPCKVVSDCTESAVLASSHFPRKPVSGHAGHTIWTLTTLNGIHVEKPFEFSFNLNEVVYHMRIASSFWESELAITAVVSARDEEQRGEISFLGTLEQLLKEIRQHAGFDCGDLVHVSEQSWKTPSFVLETDGGHRLQQDRSASWVVDPDANIVAIGCWVAAAEDEISQASLWDKGGSAVRLLVEGAIEASQYVHYQLAGTNHETTVDQR